MSIKTTTDVTSLRLKVYDLLAVIAEYKRVQTAVTATSLAKLEENRKMREEEREAVSSKLDTLIEETVLLLRTTR